ncbi:MAG: flagellar basal-body MS-ring/collar protein FliF [Acidimicrobiales bacterium]
MSMTDGSADQNTRGAANLAAARERAARLAANFDRRQRTIMAVVFAATIGAVLAFSFLGSRTDWQPLMTNLAADDASAITKQLDSLGTPYQLADGGATVMVPADVVYQTRIDVASVAMPSSGKVGYGILDNQDLTSSEFSQRIGFQRAMEGELAKTIESIDGVTAATVHLAIPKNDTFALDEQKATASVMVKTSGGKVLATRQVQAIVNLVSGGIEGLAPADVTVADGEGNVLAAPGTAPGSGSSDAKEMQSSYENTLSSSIENMLATIVGPGNAKVTVSADLDFDATSSTSETYSPPTTIVAGQALAVNETLKNETYNGSGSGTSTSGILGPTGTATPTTTVPGGGNGYQLTERQVNNAVNKVVENTNKAPGAVKRLSVAVIVNEKAVDATQLPELRTLVSAAAGISTTRGDTIAVSRFKLDTTVKNQTAKELAFADKQAKAAAAAAGAIPVWAMGAGGVLVLLVIVLALRGRKRRRKDDDLGPLELGSGDDGIITVDAMPRRQNVTDVSDGAMLVGAGAGLGAGAGAAGGEAANPGLARREVLGDLIDNQPDEVAQLLRSWLGDRREVSR